MARKDPQREAEARIEEARRTGAVWLSLADLDLTSLPECFGDLTHLEVLLVQRNPLTSLPETLGNLTQLRELVVHNNQLTSLPESLGNLTQLQQLRVSDNRLTSLPESLGNLTRLQELGVSRNELRSLPESVGNLTRLQSLWLQDNQLTSLPQSLGNLTQLRELAVSRNQLTSLPESLGKVTHLEVLFANNNQLTSLPQSLSQLTQLQALFLHNNDALGLPPEVLGPRVEDVVSRRRNPAKPADILEYYFRLRPGRRPLNEAKLILVGHGAVGKTSLVNRLVRDVFDPEEAKTEGIRITEWPIRLGDDEEVRLNVWDFGGQEIMHSTHQFFLTQRSLYLVVLNGRGGHEDADAEYWLSLVKSFGGDSPVIVVLNKVAEHPFDLNRRGLQAKFPAVRGFVRSDCADRTGIDELRQAIHRETDRLEHLRDAFPASWFAIKDRLAGMPENYVSFDRYRAICADLGEGDPRGQESLAFHLHNLGIALNYKDDPRLRDTHVLNPHWVTNGIYTILNSNALAQQKGELRVEQLAGILDPADYPPERHAFLLELMRKFELCFPFPDEEGHYLVPELLDKEQPAEADQFHRAECLSFEYRYPILPEGLLPRFIVRTHVLSPAPGRWRTGVILEFEGNRALVKADVQDKRVFIAVSGPRAARRRLLAVIRSDFEHIHRSFKFQPEEMVPVPKHPDVVVPYEDLLAWESDGRKSYSVRVGGKPVDLSVQELLVGVELGTRRVRVGPDERSAGLRVFYSYSHRDERYRDRLEIQLKLLERQGLIQSWHDRRIPPGAEWEDQIDENLERAEIVLLLVSADFLASDYCYKIEMQRALERHDAGEARVIPVIIRDCRWESVPFGKLQALPKGGKPVTKWHPQDSGWRNVGEGIERVVRELQAAGAGP